MNSQVWMGLIPVAGVLAVILGPKLLAGFKSKLLKAKHDATQETTIDTIKDIQKQEVAVVAKIKNSETISAEAQEQIKKRVNETNADIEKILKETDGREIRDSIIKDW